MSDLKTVSVAVLDCKQNVSFIVFRKVVYCISVFFRGYLSSRMYTVGLVRENLFSR